MEATGSIQAWNVDFPMCCIVKSIYNLLDTIQDSSLEKMRMYFSTINKLETKREACTCLPSVSQTRILPDISEFQPTVLRNSLIQINLTTRASISYGYMSNTTTLAFQD